MTAHAMPYMGPLAHAAYARRETAPAKVPGMTIHENTLLAGLRKGDKRAFDELVKKNHGALIRMAMRYVADRDTAEEVVQDTWIAVIDGISRFEGRSSLESWMFAILIHKAKDRGVRESRHNTFSAFESHDDEGEEAVDPARFHASGELAGHWALPPQPWNEQTPERLLASRQALEALSKAVDELPAGLRDVLVLKDVEGLESQDICERLGITDNNLYVRLHRARERVRQAVEISLRGNGHRDVSNAGFATLMSIAQSVSRKPCPLNEKRAESRVGSW
jgi:RNA polymerase sigma-70 factor (ECF subfamily)